MLKKLKKSFTFIETLVVVGVMALVLPTLFAIFFIIIRQQVRIYAVTEVKRQGDYLNSILQDSIKNYGYTIYDSGGTEICGPGDLAQHAVGFFKDKYLNGIGFGVSAGNTIISMITNLGPPAPTLPYTPGDLTNSKVGINSFTMTCQRQSRYSGPIITTNFSICYKGSQASCILTGEGNVSLNYNTVIKLRNFPTQ